MSELAVGQELSFEYKVQPKDLASELPLIEGEQYPAVFATSRMIALMELAAARQLVPRQKEGELSVGVGVNITHKAATLVGETVKVTGRFLAQEGKLYRFAVIVEDGAGIAGEGEHTRAIIAEQRLMDGAEKRKQG